MVALGRKYDTGLFLSPTKETCFLYLYTCYFDEDYVRYARNCVLYETWLIFTFLLRSADKVGRPFCFLFCFLLFFFFFLIFLYRSPASRDFSVISQPISMKFGMLIVLDETNRLNIFFKSIRLGVGIRRGPKILLCFIIGKTLYTVRRDKNFT